MARSYRLYCSVYGCLSSSRLEPEISFFKLPIQSARLSEWLRLMCRDDLTNKPNTNYRICEKHFNIQDILASPNRKVLKKNALPSLNLPDLQKLQSTVRERSRKKVKGTQTENTDPTKILIAKVYHYFEQEYEELKTIYADLDLTPLSKFRQRTALATGVSETTVLQILKEEERRNVDKRKEPPEKRRRARKRSRQTNSSNEKDSSDDNGDVMEQSSNEAQTVVVKIEPPEYYNEEPEVYVAAVKVEPSDIELDNEESEIYVPAAAVKVEPSDIELNNEEPEIYVPATVKVEPSDIELYHEESEIYVPAASVKVEPSDIELNKEQAQTDPICLHVKTEPRSDVVDNTNETLALNEASGTKRKARKIPRSDVTPTRQHTRGDCSTAAAASSVRLTGVLDESNLFGDTEIKMEKIEIHEEGVG